MSLMLSSCCTFRLNRRNALSKVSPSWTETSAKLVVTPCLDKKSVDPNRILQQSYRNRRVRQN